jgi:hypothetical protein
MFDATRRHLLLHTFISSATGCASLCLHTRLGLIVDGFLAVVNKLLDTFLKFVKNCDLKVM